MEFGINVVLSLGYIKFCVRIYYNRENMLLIPRKHQRILYVFSTTCRVVVIILYNGVDKEFPIRLYYNFTPLGYNV